MSTKEKHIVSFDKIKEMINDEPTHLKDFYNAAITSFSSFEDDFRKSMYSNDLKSLREAGHRIIPAAQMVGVDELITLYEKSKEVLSTEHSEKDLKIIITRVHDICDWVISDFEQKLAEL